MQGITRYIVCPAEGETATGAPLVFRDERAARNCAAMFCGQAEVIRYWIELSNDEINALVFDKLAEDL